ncbi:hypothetical protein P4O66_011574 [Electrophorus voltai]|uniref:EF-hand domain-containing protein n=1 Tax=Electrophorus voltai TaxID=2609070 RepID=A0AAD9DVI8_9TELE|nr:hypothetical protein P4O66_011574 [Electrophorus voltai]
MVTDPGAVISISDTRRWVLTVALPAPCVCASFALLLTSGAAAGAFDGSALLPGLLLPGWQLLLPALTHELDKRLSQLKMRDAPPSHGHLPSGRCVDHDSDGHVSFKDFENVIGYGLANS